MVVGGFGVVVGGIVCGFSVGFAVTGACVVVTGACVVVLGGCVVVTGACVDVTEA